MVNASFFRFTGWLILAVTALAIEPSFAGPSVVGTNGVLDSVQQTIQTTAAGWSTQALGYANKLFFGLAALEFSWSAIQLTLKKNDLPDIIVGTLFKVMSLAFFAMLLTEAPTWIPMIIDSFTQAGTAVAGGGTPLTPSGVIDQGITLASDLVTKGTGAITANQGTGMVATVKHLPGNLLADIIIGLTGIMIILSFAVIALQLFVTLVESYVVIGGGVLMLGFLGSRWTSNFGEKYFAYAISIGIKLFTLYLIIGFGNDLVTQMGIQLDALVKSGQPVGFGDWLAMGGTSAVYGGVGYMVPGLAGTMMNGSPNMTMSNMGAAGGALAAAPVAAGLATGAAGAQAIGLAAKLAGTTKSGAAGGIGGSAASGGGFAGGIAGGTAGLSRLTQAGGGAASAAGSAAQATGQGAQAAAGAAGKAGGLTGNVATDVKNAVMGGGASGSGSGTSGGAAGSVPKNGGDAISKGAGESAGKAGSSAANVESKAGGNGFASSPNSGGGGQNDTGGMSAGNAESGNAQRSFDADQRQDKKKSFSDKMLDKSQDLQHAADRQKPNLAHDGSSGSGISIRFNHE